MFEESGLYLKASLDLLFPRRCIVCGERLGLHEEHLCLVCMQDIPYTYYWMSSHNVMADRFNARLQEWLDESAEAVHSVGERQRESYAYAAALYFYRDGSDYREMVRRLKYEGDLPLGRRLSRMLASRLRTAAHFSDVDLVVPVPLHWTRRLSRGYNQAEVIAGELARVFGVPMRTDITRRCRRTRTQTKLTVGEKAGNVRGAFEPCAHWRRRARGNGDQIVAPGIRHILLVDDTFTTGVTTLECFKALREVLPPDTRISIVTLACVE